MSNINYAGLSVLIGAIAAAIPIIGGFILQCITFYRQGKIRQDATRREAKIDELAVKINGAQDKIADMAFVAGQQSAAAAILSRDDHV